MLTHQWPAENSWYQINWFPNVTWGHISSLELNSIVCPAAPQEVMLAAGSGAVKGKGGCKHIQALWSDGQQEGSPLRCYWNYERLFIFPLRRGLGEKKRWRGTLQGCPLKNVCQAFIVTANIYSNSGIPWMWFSRCCCLELWGTDYWRQTGDIWELNRWSLVQTVTPEHPLLSSSAVSFSLFLYLKHSHMAALICSHQC